jgi:HD-GYP domain-containing protein (c-di-GMP phosphodiesterase class II)
MPQEKVLGILREESATRIDPQCVAMLEDLATENRL